MLKVSGGTPPVTTTQATRENYISFLDMVAPNIDRNLYERYPTETTDITSLFREIGRYRPTTNRKFEHFEMDRAYQVVTSAGVVAQPAAGGNITVTLSAADHGVSGKTSLPRVGEIVMFPNRVIGTIIAKSTTTDNAHTITVAPNLVATQFPALTATSKIMILSKAEREGSVPGTEQLSRNPSRWSGLVQTIREDYTVTGDAASVTGWVEVLEKSELARRIGGSGYKWFIKEEKTAYDNLMKNIEMALLHGSRTDNPAILTAKGAGTGNLDLAYTTTSGLLTSIDAYGLTPTYTPGSLALTDFQDLSDLLDANEGAKEYMVFAGNAVLHEKDDLITETFQNGAVTYGAFGNSEDRAVRYGFNSFMLGGRSWHFKKYAPFYHPGLFAGLNADFDKDWFGIPMDLRKDAKSSEMLPSLSIRYLANGGPDAHGLTPNQPQTLSYGMESTVFGGFPLPEAARTNGDDTATISMIAKVGLQAVGLNRFFHYLG